MCCTQLGPCRAPARHSHSQRCPSCLVRPLPPPTLLVNVKCTLTIKQLEAEVVDEVIRHPGLERSGKRGSVDDDGSNNKSGNKPGTTTVTSVTPMSEVMVTMVVFDGITWEVHSVMNSGMFLTNLASLWYDRSFYPKSGIDASQIPDFGKQTKKVTMAPRRR